MVHCKIDVKKIVSNEVFRGKRTSAEQSHSSLIYRETKTRKETVSVSENVKSLVLYYKTQLTDGVENLVSRKLDRTRNVLKEKWNFIKKEERKMELQRLR